LPLDDLITDGVTLVGSRGHVGHLRWVVRQMARGKIDPRPLVTHRLRGLAELADWLVHSERFARAGKVVCALG
jgi:threonine dehydrogenase-like Zn-dependent dehydrogenase